MIQTGRVRCAYNEARLLDATNYLPKSKFNEIEFTSAMVPPNRWPPLLGPIQKEHLLPLADLIL
jgi:hypothetical protein